MTKIKDIRIFDEYDCRYEVNEIDIDNNEGILQLYINPPSLCLSTELSKLAVVKREIEDAIMNVLSINGMPINKVKFFQDSGIILLRFDSVVATIRVAELCHIHETAVTPYENGFAYINAEKAVGLGRVDYD